MSAHEEQPIEASGTYRAEQIDKASAEFSSDLIEERVEANREPLLEQNSILTQLMNKFIQDNSTITNPTAGPGDRRFQSESPLTHGPRISRTLILTSIRTAGYSPAE